MNEKELKLPRVAIQGYEGCFHQEAAELFFGKSILPICCDNFRQLVNVVSSKRSSEAGVMAIENSIAGSILPNYNLLKKNSNLHIVGEVYLSICQNLMVLPGVQISDIQEVRSHPMALLQCTDYLDAENWKLVETDDTALSAKDVSDNKLKHVAAIASRSAADIYGLDIIAPEINTLKKNYTRFLILKRDDDSQPIKDADKASLYFQTDHSQGSLAKVLSQISKFNVNLSLLQSFPIPKEVWQYSFHADLEFENLEDFHKTLSAITPMVKNLRIYGVYKNGKTKN